MSSYDRDKLSEIAEIFQKFTKAFSTDNTLDSDQYKEQAEELLTELGYTEYCHGGTYRRVYTNPTEDIVLKFAMGLKGEEENSSEIRNNTRLSNTEIKDPFDQGTCYGDKYVADILDYEKNTHRWIIMQKVQVTPNNVSTTEATKIKKAFSSAGIHIDEIEPINMGTIQNSPVIFDYAGT